MTHRTEELIRRLSETHHLSVSEYEELLASRSPEAANMLLEQADKARRQIFGNAVYTRGLIEISNICKNNCFYCGIRAGNSHCERYRLTPEQILQCAAEGYDLGFRTFVLQGGEDPYYTDEILCDIVRSLKERYPDCAVTLSMGERGRESFQRLFDAGADRYLLRHETADPVLYSRLHPASMSFENRMQCLRDLREIGYQVGAGFMVGSPGQTLRELAEDLKFIEEFHPEMCGIGPFLPHHDTVFRDEPAGSVELTLYLLSILRLIYPPMLIPATTALGTADPLGREKGIQAGANVVMPNLSPVNVRRQYELYDNKICTGEESAQCRNCLNLRMDSIGFTLTVDRGDFPGTRNEAEDIVCP